MPALVALTGASGFIGRAILQKLVKRGYNVRALVRKPQPDTESVQWIQGDLSNTAALHELAKDAFAIIHCAGQVRGNSLETFVQTNVEGTKNLVRAAINQTVKPRFPPHFFFSRQTARNSLGMQKASKWPNNPWPNTQVICNGQPFARLRFMGLATRK